MGHLNVEIHSKMRARTARARDDGRLREEDFSEHPRGWKARLRSALGFVFTATVFISAFAGGFIFVLYAVQLPGLPRLP